MGSFRDMYSVRENVLQKETLGSMDNECFQDKKRSKLIIYPSRFSAGLTTAFQEQFTKSIQIEILRTMLY